MVDIAAIVGVAATRLGHVRLLSLVRVVPVLLREGVHGRTAQRRQVRYVKRSA